MLFQPNHLLFLFEKLRNHLNLLIENICNLKEKRKKYINVWIVIDEKWRSFLKSWTFFLLEMGKINFETVRDYVFSRLEKELNSNLWYHGVHHTRDDVLPAAIRLGMLEGMAGEELLLLQTGALYHDIGYIEQYAKNESIGVRIASETLPGFGYLQEQIKRVGQIIMATQLQMDNGRMIQVPDSRDILQLLMCDADLDSLGRPDFFEISENLRWELQEYGMAKTPYEWMQGQLAFQENHSYFTNAARSLREEGKRRNIAEIKTLLAEF